ncbi:MAG: hypothetical protein D6702_10390 [Planctomycetota bacterium]|nr:MAG: hypothetical protein D6702_10390 [Planctomycetota bacterium]
MAVAPFTLLFLLFAQGFSGRILDVRDPGELYGPAGRFAFPDWDWPGDVKDDQFWPVDPRTYATRALAIGDSIVGEVEALHPGGDQPVRSLVWDRSLRPIEWPPRARVLAANDDGRLLVRLPADGPTLIDLSGRGAELPLPPRTEDWRFLVLGPGGLVLGRARVAGEERLVVSHLRRSGKGEWRLLPARFRPRAANEQGWLVGEDDRGRPLVFGPLLRQGRLAAQGWLDQRSPLLWRGPADATLVTISGGRVAGHAVVGGRGRVWVWELDPRAAEIGAMGEELPTRADGVALDFGSDEQLLGRDGGRPVLWVRRRKEWKRIDLRQALPQKTAFRLIDVVGINARGHIAGTAELTEEVTGRPYRRAVRLVPRRG